MAKLYIVGENFGTGRYYDIVTGTVTEITDLNVLKWLEKNSHKVFGKGSIYTYNLTFVANFRYLGGSVSISKMNRDVIKDPRLIFIYQ